MPIKVRMLRLWLMLAELGLGWERRLILQSKFGISFIDLWLIMLVQQCVSQYLQWSRFLSRLLMVTFHISSNWYSLGQLFFLGDIVFQLADYTPTQHQLDTSVSWNICLSNIDPSTRKPIRPSMGELILKGSPSKQEDTLQSSYEYTADHSID